LRDRHNKMIGLSQATYIGKILTRFSMTDCKGAVAPYKYGIKLSKSQNPKTPMDIDHMKRISYASAIGSFFHVCYVLYKTRYMSCDWDGESIPK